MSIDPLGNSSVFGRAVMFSLKTLGRILITTLTWAIAWGLVGAAVGAVSTVIKPDTGYIPHNFVPLMMGVPRAAFGAMAVPIFASVMAPVRITSLLGLKGRMLLGAVVGAIAGIVLMNLLAHSVITILLATFLGAALAARFARYQALAERK
jgi:hypothetical protein